MFKSKIAKNLLFKTHQNDPSKINNIKENTYYFNIWKRSLVWKYFAKHKLQVSSYGGAGTTILSKKLIPEFPKKIPRKTSWQNYDGNTKKKIEEIYESLCQKISKLEDYFII